MAGANIQQAAGGKLGGLPSVGSGTGSATTGFRRMTNSGAGAGPPEDAEQFKQPETILRCVGGLSWGRGLWWWWSLVFMVVVVVVVVFVGFVGFVVGCGCCRSLCECGGNFTAFSWDLRCC